MNNKHIFGPLLKGGNPGDQAITVRMAADSLYGLNVRPAIDLLAKYFHCLGTVLKKPSQRALRLISGKHHCALLPPEIMLQMVADAAGVTHPRSRNNNLGRHIKVNIF